MKNEKTIKERISQCLKFFLKGQFFNLVVGALMFVPNVMSLAATWIYSYNGYLLSGWEEGLSTTITLFLMVFINQVVGWCYWFKKLEEVGEKKIKQVTCRTLPFLLIGMSLIFFFSLMDFSPEAKANAIEYQQTLEEAKASEDAYQYHLTQLPDDVKLQALGAYLLTFNEGEAFAAYLSTPHQLFTDKLSSLHLNKDENAVLNYFKQLNPSMSSEQQHELAFELFQGNKERFMTLLNEPFESDPSYMLSSLSAHILSFELTYYDLMLERVVYEGVDLNVLDLSLKEIIQRLEQAKSLPEINQGVLFLLEYHQSYYIECLEQIDQGGEVLKDNFDAYKEEHGIYYSTFDPYEQIADYLVNSY